MCKPKCPLCGAVSAWRMFPNRPDLNHEIPDECHFCKQEDYIHEKDWKQGIELTQYGGTPSVNPHPTRDGNGN